MQDSNSNYLQTRLNINWEKNQSQTIDLLRFPLVVCVVFIHQFPNVTNILDADFQLLSGRGVYNLICIIFSVILPRIAVPTFFFISGYLFFSNVKSWSWDKYTDKIHRRIHSLLVPYIVWNFIPVIIDVTRHIIDAIKYNSLYALSEYCQETSFYNVFIEHEKTDISTNIFGWATFGSCPINSPLWFIRDLIVVCILSPIIYYLIKKIKIGIIFIFAIGYIFNITIPIPGFSFTAFLFFSLGAFFAIQSINITSLSRKVCTYLIPIAIISLIASTIYRNNYIISIFILTSIFALFASISLLIDKYGIKPNSTLVKSCFFIYASHLICLFIWETPVTFSQKILDRIIIGNDTYLQQCASYFFAPFMAIGICLLIYNILRRFVPKLCRMLCGNR